VFIEAVRGTDREIIAHCYETGAVRRVYLRAAKTSPNEHYEISGYGTARALARQPRELYHPA
jgi:ferritin-like metal-binding protein YciE